MKPSGVALNAILSHIATVRSVASSIASARVFDVTPQQLKDWSLGIVENLELAEERLLDIFGMPDPGVQSASTAQVLPVAKRRGSRVMVQRSSSPSPAPLANSSHSLLTVRDSVVEVRRSSESVDADTPRSTKKTPQPSKDMNISIPSASSRTPDKSENLLPLQALQAALYLVMEAICYRCRAVKGYLFLYVGAKDELHAVTAVGVGASVSAGSPGHAPLALPASSGKAGDVLNTGVAINLTHGALNHDKGPATTLPATSPRGAAPAGSPRGAPQGNRSQPQGSYAKSALLFPIRALNGDSRIGVVQLMNKVGRVSQFTQEDEYQLHAFSHLLSYLVDRYPIDLLTMVPFDPSPLHRVVPFTFGPSTHDGLLPQIMEGQTKQLIYRTVQSGQYIRKKDILDNKVALSNTAANMEEIDTYIENLEQCWRTSAHKSVELERDTGDMEAQLILMRSDLSKAKQRVKELNERLRQYEE